MTNETNGKLDTLITKVGENSEKLDSIETLLVGDVKDTRKVGILERIRKLEKWYDEFKQEFTWIKRLFVGAIILNVIGLIFYYIQNSF